MTESIEDLSLVSIKSEITKLSKMLEWVQNSYENYQRLITISAEQQLGEALGKHKGEPLILIGSGYTLDLAMPWIKQWTGKIMCGPSQVATLWNETGRMPDYIVGHDSSPRNTEYLRLDKLNYGGTTLLTNPCWLPAVLEGWLDRGYKTMLYNLCPVFHESITDHHALSWGAFTEKYKPQPDHPVFWYLRDAHVIFFKEILQMAYPHITLSVLACSDTPSEAMIIADLLGFDPVYLVGVDHGFVDGMNRCTMYVYNDDTQAWQKVPPVKIEKPDYISENGIGTDTLLATAKVVTIAIARAAQGKIYEVSPGGAYGIDNFFPRCTPDEMLFNTANDTGETPEARTARAQDWLNTHNKGTWYKTATVHTKTQVGKEQNADGTLRKD